jgi:hypothetical protein
MLRIYSFAEEVVRGAIVTLFLHIIQCLLFFLDNLLYIMYISYI